MIPQSDRDILVGRVRRWVKDFIAGRRDWNQSVQAACLYHAHFTCVEFNRYFATTKTQACCIVQAGSMSWPHMDMAKDDGVSPTHFTYQWEPTSVQTYLKLLDGDMPEMHVWNGIIRPLEYGDHIIVDLTTCHLPAQAKQTANMDWTGPKPPDYLFATPLTIPDHVVYAPDKDATILALQMVRNSGL